jgi:glycosyltransferase involved in cell wall biosynthesis
VACVPSYGEPFGLAALEAMASGLPVVGTAAGGLAHVLPDDGGVKVPPGDAELLAEALAALLTDPARREAMGTANRRLVERDYAWDSVIDRLERIYARTLAR